MAKRIRLSANDTDWFTLPGNTGTLRNEAGELVDTIFGQAYESTEAGLISWTLSANALIKGFAGYVARLRKGGTPTTITDEPMSLVSGKTYRVTDTTKQMIDFDTAVVVEDGGSPVASADIESINYLTGEVTFVSGYTVGGSVTLTGKYLPMTEILGTKDWTLNMTIAAIDNTDIPTARGNQGLRTFQRDGLKSVALEIGGNWKSSNAFVTALKARVPLYVDISPDGSGHATAYGLFKYTQQEQGGDVGALEEETINLRLSVREGEKIKSAFDWRFGVSSTVSQAIRLAIDSFLNNAALYAQYLPDGSAGHKGEVVVTDLSLSGGLESMNEFTVNLQGSGATSAVP